MMFAAWRGSRGGRIAAAVSSGAAARGLSSLVTLVSLPLAVRYLGAERFGVWATISSTVVFLNLLDLGIAGTLTNHIAQSYAVGDRRHAARYVSNALALTAAVAAGVGALLALAWPHLDWVRVFNVSAAVSPGEVSSTVAAAVALVLLGLPASLSNRILAGFQEVHVSNLVVALATAANLAGLLAGIGLRVSMPVLFLLATGWITLGNLVLLAALLLWRKPWLRPRRSLLAWAAARELLSSGSGFLLIQIAGAVVFSSDNVVLSHFLGPAQVTPYNVTWRLVGLTAAMQGLLFPALWPAYAEAYVRSDLAWMRRAFRLTLRATLALNLGVAALLLAFGRTLIGWWAGAAAVPSFALLAMMSLWAVLSGAMTVESCLLAAVNRTRVQGVLSMIAAAVNLGLSIVLVQRVGAVGVIAGTVVSYLLVLVVPQSLLVRQVLESNQAQLSRGPILSGVFARKPDCAPSPDSPML
jgi:O-antigen/teichoic acid export membrane protein